MNENNAPDENLNEQDVTSIEPAVPTETPAANLNDPVAYPAKKPRSKSTIILLSLLGVVVVGAVTVLGIWLSQGGSLGSLVANNSEAEETQQTETPANASEVIANIKSALDEQVLPMYADTKITDSNVGPQYKVDGYDFYTSSQGSSIRIDVGEIDAQEQTQANELVRQAVDSSLKSDGLTLTAGSLEDMTARLTYQNDAVVCVYNDQIQPIWLDCANKNDYAPAAEAVQPFVTAYNQANPENTNNLFGAPTTKASPTEGYQTSEVSIGVFEGTGGFAGLFYSVNGTWKYFTGTQNILSCDRYNTDELKIAYEGTACFDEATNSESVVAKP